MMGTDSTGGTSRGSGKPPVFDFQSFLSWLRGKGYAFSSVDVTRHLYHTYGFQRLVPYFDFIERACVPAGACSVDAVHELVRFDEELRVLLVRWIGVVEMQVRSRYCQAMLDECGPYCLYGASYFRNERERASTLHLVDADLKKHARNNAGVRRAQSTGDGRVPVWAAVDAVTFGTLRRLYDNTAVPEVATRVSASFGVNKKCFRSWLRTLVLVRNCCAHFNPYAVRAQIPAVPKPVIEPAEGGGCGADGTSSTGTGGAHADDNASPLYVLAVLDRLLQGRARAGTEFEREDWHSFRRDARQLVGEFAREHPELVQALRIPPGFADRCAASHFPVIRFKKGPRKEMLWSVSLAA